MEEKDIKQIKRKKAIIETMAFLFLYFIVLIMSLFTANYRRRMLIVHYCSIILLAGPILFIIYMKIIWKDFKARNILAIVLLIIFLVYKYMIVMTVFFDLHWPDDLPTLIAKGEISKVKGIEGYIIKMLEVLSAISQVVAYTYIEKCFRKKLAPYEVKENKKSKKENKWKKKIK